MPGQEQFNDRPPQVVVVGSFVQDLAFSTAAFPAPGESRIGTFRTGAGGKGFNQAVACHRQEIPTLFIGAVGDDVFARAVSDFSKAEGLRTAFEIKKDYPTGAASIVVNQSGENLIVVALGANEHLSVAHIKEYEQEIAQASILISQLECSLKAVGYAIGAAREHGVTTILNPAPINHGLSIEILKQADILTPNETEFSFLLQKLFAINLGENYWQRSDEELHALCRKCEVPSVVLTLGGQGCFVSHQDARAANNRGAQRISDSQKFYRVPAQAITPVDTTGAGDAFNGGLAAGILYFPGEFHKAVRYATIVAGLSTLKEGTAPAMPSRGEVVRKFSASEI
jgi:ribokinase